MRLIGELLRDPFAIIIPLALLGVSIVAGLIVRRLLFRAVKTWADRTDGHAGVLIMDTLRGPIVLWAIILGLHLATQNSEIPRRYLRYVPSTLGALWILSLTIATSRLAGNWVRFYGSRVTGAQAVTSLTQKLVQILVVLLGLIWFLKVVFNISLSSLSPLLTTVGVGGIAVALGLQDTLSNLFAGFYVSVSGLIRVGDYIKLNTGEEGYITDINWRCTMMRGLSNNLVIVPNSKLGQAIYTNYCLPDTRITMSVSFSVGYESDIDHVEKVLLEESLAATKILPGLVRDPPPYIRFDPGPADWALVFQVNFSVAQFSDQYRVRSELRKRLFQRLQREGIDMPFPTRTVLVESKHPSDGQELKS